jgi:hypothetical protein
MEKKLVIAKYNEDVNWIDQIDSEYTIYNKGDIIEKPTINVENIGRESETYLRYIKDNYNDLPDIIIFAQGHPFDHCSNFIEQVNSIDLQSKNYAFLSNLVLDASSDSGHNISIISELIDEFIDSKFDHANTVWKFGAGAQYAVTKDCIIRKPIDWWIKLHEKHIEYCYKNEIYALNAPHAFERIWPLIWEK